MRRGFGLSSCNPEARRQGSIGFGDRRGTAAAADKHASRVATNILTASNGGIAPNVATARANYPSHQLNDRSGGRKAFATIL